jgi:hypothetical protein
MGQSGAVGRFGMKLFKGAVVLKHFDGKMNNSMQEANPRE